MSSSGAFTPGGAPTALSNGSATFAVETSSLGTSSVTITIDDATSSLSTTKSYTFATGAAAQIAVSPSATNVPALNYYTEAGQPVTVTAQLEDA